MKKKDREKRLKAKKIMLAVQEKAPKITGVTVGGPTPGMRFEVDLKAGGHLVATPENPVFSAAVYRYTFPINKPR